MQSRNCVLLCTCCVLTACRFETVSYCVLAVYSLHACVLLCTCCVLTACRFETVYYCVLAVYSLHACVLLCTGCVFTTYTVELCTAVYLLRNCVLLCTCCVLRKFVYSTQKVDFFLMKKATANVYWFDGRIKRVVFPVLVAVRNHCHVLVHRHTVIQHICIFVCKTNISAQKNTILRKLMCFAHNIPISRTIGCFAQNRFDFTQHTTHHS